MMRKLIFTFFLVVCSLSAASADVKIFLYPRCEGEGSILLSSAAWIEGDADETAKLRALSIDKKFFKDGYLDRREIASILNEKFSGSYTIIGSSVRVTAPAAEVVVIEELAAQSVKKGDAVKVIVRRKGITLETQGVAAADALPGDEVSVELGKKRMVKGILQEEHIVEVRF